MRREEEREEERHRHRHRHTDTDTQTQTHRQSEAAHILAGREFREQVRLPNCTHARAGSDSHRGSGCVQRVCISESSQRGVYRLQIGARAKQRGSGGGGGEGAGVQKIPTSTDIATCRRHSWALEFRAPSRPSRSHSALLSSPHRHPSNPLSQTSPPCTRALPSTHTRIFPLRVLVSLFHTKRAIPDAQPSELTDH